MFLGHSYPILVDCNNLYKILIWIKNLRWGKIRVCDFNKDLFNSVSAYIIMKVKQFIFLSILLTRPVCLYQYSKQTNWLLFFFNGTTYCYTKEHSSYVFYFLYILYFWEDCILNIILGESSFPNSSLLPIAMLRSMRADGPSS